MPELENPGDRESAESRSVGRSYTLSAGLFEVPCETFNNCSATSMRLAPNMSHSAQNQIFIKWRVTREQGLFWFRLPPMSTIYINYNFSL